MVPNDKRVEQLIREIEETGEHLIDPEVAARIIEESPDAILIVRGDGTIGTGNRAAEQLFGYTRQEMHSMPVSTLVPEDRHVAHAAGMSTYLKEPYIRPMQLSDKFVAKSKSGDVFAVHIALAPLVLEPGVYVVAYVRRR
jgi:hypothetical protein